MDYYDEAVSCPECGQELTIEYVTGTSSPLSTAINSRCPECAGLIHVELPRSAVSFVARRKHDASVLRGVAELANELRSMRRVGR
jgi:hypothetical protein